MSKSARDDFFMPTSKKAPWKIVRSIFSFFVVVGMLVGVLYALAWKPVPNGTPYNPYISDSLLKKLPSTGYYKFEPGKKVSLFRSSLLVERISDKWLLTRTSGTTRHAKSYESILIQRPLLDSRFPSGPWVKVLNLKHPLVEAAPMNTLYIPDAGWVVFNERKLFFIDEKEEE